MPGTLDFTGSELWAPFNFTQITALSTNFKSIQAKVTLKISRFFNIILPFFLVFPRVWHLITLKLDQGWVGHLNGFLAQGVRNFLFILLPTKVL